MTLQLFCFVFAKIDKLILKLIRQIKEHRITKTIKAHPPHSIRKNSYSGSEISTSELILLENAGVNHPDFLSKAVVSLTPKTQATKEEMDELDTTEVEHFGKSNNTTSQVKRQPTDWEKTCARSHV